MFITGWIAIISEIILLLIWIYSIFFSRNRTDPAGKGMAMVFLLGLIAYIIGGILLLMIRQSWSSVLVIGMAALPLAIVIIGLWKQYGPGNKKRYQDF